MNTPIIPVSKRSIKNVNSFTFFFILDQLEINVSGVIKVVSNNSNIDMPSKPTKKLILRFDIHLNLYKNWKSPFSTLKLK